MPKPILCVDFDGVIHSYSSGWQGADVISDPPIPNALQWLWRATEFWEINIYSSRTDQIGGIKAMQDWMRKNILKELNENQDLLWRETPGECATIFMMTIKFPSQKPPAQLTIDDRAICFDGDWSKLDPSELLNFKPWNKR